MASYADEYKMFRAACDAVEASQDYTSQKKIMARRDWSLAQQKCEDEGVCRNCQGTPVQFAHIWTRGMGSTNDPDEGIILCLSCHTKFDRHNLDVLHLLTLDEQITLVRNAGSIERARQRVLPSEYKRT